MVHLCLKNPWKTCGAARQSLDFPGGQPGSVDSYDPHMRNRASHHFAAVAILKPKIVTLYLEARNDDY